MWFFHVAYCFFSTVPSLFPQSGLSLRAGRFESQGAIEVLCMVCRAVFKLCGLLGFKECSFWC